MPTIKEAISNLFAEQESCTISDLVRECGERCDEKPSALMPLIVTTIAEMIGDGTICGCNQEDKGDNWVYAWDYAWVLSATL